MRYARALVLAVAAIALLSGCSDRPNDLDTYYDDPPAGATSSSQADERSGRTGPSSAAEDAPASPTKTLDRVDVAAVLLTDQDVAGEGVFRVSGGLKALPGCLGMLPKQTGAKFARAATWQYPTGSALNQLALGYPGREASTVLHSVPCADGQPVPVDLPPTVDAARSWCAGATCAVLLGRDHIVSGVQVAAGTAERAREAVRRLVPQAVTTLLEATRPR